MCYFWLLDAHFQRPARYTFHPSQTSPVVCVEILLQVWLHSRQLGSAVGQGFPMLCHPVGSVRVDSLQKRQDHRSQRHKVLRWARSQLLPSIGRADWPVGVGGRVTDKWETLSLRC